MSFAPPFSARYRRVSVLVPSLLFAAGLLLVACSEGTQPIDDRFPVAQPVLLSVVVDDGDVTVEAGVAGAVIVTGELDPARYRYESSDGAGTVRLEVRRVRSLRSLLSGGAASLRVLVPPGTHLDVTTSNGQITVTGPLGGGRLESSNADVLVTRVDGGLAVRTSNGSVRVTDHSGELTIVSSNGNVIVLGHDDGAVVIETNNGLIEYAGTIESGGPNELLTVNGSIVVALAGSASVMLDARTTNGTVTSRYAILEAERSPTELRGRIAGGEATLRLRATNGSIEVR